MKFFKCDVCGKIVAMVKATDVDTVCCGKPMRELVPGTTDGAAEKHVPVYSVTDNTVTVKVGSVAHPMLDAHHIEWIAIETKKGAQRKKLNPGEAPKAEFMLTEDDELVAVYEYCNLHGLFKAENK